MQHSSCLQIDGPLLSFDGLWFNTNRCNGRKISPADDNMTNPHHCPSAWKYITVMASQPESCQPEGHLFKEAYRFFYKSRHSARPLPELLARQNTREKLDRHKGWKTPNMVIGKSKESPNANGQWHRDLKQQTPSGCPWERWPSSSTAACWSWSTTAGLQLPNYCGGYHTGASHGQGPLWGLLSIPQFLGQWLQWTRWFNCFSD